MTEQMTELKMTEKNDRTKMTEKMTELAEK